MYTKQDIINMKGNKFELFACYTKTISKMPDYFVLQRNGHIFDAFELKDGYYYAMSMFDVRKIKERKKHWIILYAWGETMKLKNILNKYADSRIIGVDIDDKNAIIYIADQNDIITNTYAGKMPKNQTTYRFDWNYKISTDNIGKSLRGIVRNCKLNQIHYVVLK